MSQKTKSKKLEQKSKYNLNPKYYRYYVDYYSHSAYDCDRWGCDSICRCGTIADVDIEGFSLSLKEITGKADVSNVEEYCIDRAIALLDVDNVSWSAINGYYGEEVEIDADMAFAHLEEVLSLLNKNQVTQAVENILNKEYGHLLPELKDKIWHFKEVSIKEVGHNSAYKKLNKTLIDNLVKSEKDLTCLCVLDKNGLRLIDGNHRFQAALTRGDKTIKVIYCEA